MLDYEEAFQCKCVFSTMNQESTTFFGLLIRDLPPPTLHSGGLKGFTHLLHCWFSC